MEITAQTLADLLGGEIVGDPNTVVTAPARIEQGKKGNICFFANPKYEHYIYDTKASVLLINRSFEPKQEIPATLIKVDDAYQGVAKLLDYFSSLKKNRRCGNRFRARLSLRNSIACSARIGKGTYIYPQVFIGENVRIGRNCLIYPGVRICHGTVIGDGCTFHANAVIGDDGFGFAPTVDGSYKKIPQMGNVIIEDNVEIGSGTTVDRATMNSTVIHKGVKIDNLCMVAHNVEIGENTVMAAQSGIAGSAKVGRHCIIGGQCGIQGHITISDNTSLAGGTGVIGSIKEPGKAYMGRPALEYRNFMRSYAMFKNAPNQK